jgi:hypothetical protein
MVVLVESTLLVSTTWLAFWAETVSVELWPEAICVGFALMVTVGAGGGAEPTVMLSLEEKKKPVVSHARITMACFPVASATDADSVALVLLAFWTLSMYIIMAVTVCSLSRAAARKLVGDATVAPLAGAQIFTVLSTVLLQVCAWPWLLLKPRNNIRKANDSAAEEKRDSVTATNPWEIKVGIIWRHGIAGRDSTSVRQLWFQTL